MRLGLHGSVKRHIGPTKRFAPSISSDISCPHSFSDDHGIQLEVDCLQCAGAHDLRNRKCLVGVINVITAGAEPEAIILKRYTHKRYRGTPVGRAVLAALELAALNRAKVALDEPSDKRCQTCPVSTEQIVSFLRHRLLEDPITYLSSMDRIADEIEHRSLAHACERTRACILKGLSLSTVQRR